MDVICHVGTPALPIQSRVLELASRQGREADIRMKVMVEKDHARWMTGTQLLRLLLSCIELNACGTRCFDQLP